MAINCSDFLFFRKDADFLVYDKKSAYLYSIDDIHFEIGRTLQIALQRDDSVLGVEYFIQKFIDQSPDIILDHYEFIIRLFSERGYENLVKETITERDLIQSISAVPHIVVEVTEKCNFICRYCYYGEMYDAINISKTRNKDMPEGDCLKCLRELLLNKDLLYSNKSVISFYGGEPFLNFRLIKKIVLFCKREFPDIEFQFRATTNGSLLKNHIEFLREHDFHLLVSLDGDSRSDMHRCYRNGKPSFSTVENNVNLVFEKHREYFMHNIEFISVLHQDSDIVSICRFFSKYEKTPILTNLSSEGVVADKEFVKPYKGASVQEINELFAVNRSVYDLIIAASRESLSIDPLYSNLNYFNLRGCYLFANKIFLSADEHVYLCEKSSRQFPFGSFVGGDLIFFLDDINRYYREFDKVVKSECVNCAMNHLCDRCFFESPSQMASPIKCIVSDEKMKQKLIRVMSYE